MPWVVRVPFTVLSDPLMRRLTILALMLWVVAAPFLGPGHALIHGDDHGDRHDCASGHAHSESEHHGCEACASLPDAPVVYALCDVPDCPDSDHHHHDADDDAEAPHLCVVCHVAPLLVAAAPPSPTLAPSAEFLTVARAIRLGFDHAGTPGARAPPAIQI